MSTRYVWLLVGAVLAAALPAASMAGPLDPVPVGQVVGFPIHLIETEGDFAYCGADDVQDYDTSSMRPTLGVIEVFDLTGSDEPELVGIAHLPDTLEDLAVSSGFVYAVAYGGDGLIVDATDPGSPHLSGMFSSGAVSRVTTAGSYLYVSDRTQGLQIFDIADRAHPSLVGTLPCGDTPYEAVAVSGDYAYATTQGAQFAVIDVSDPSRPREIARLSDLAGSIGDGLVVSGDRVYLIGWAVKVVDVSVPSSPKFVGWQSGIGINSEDGVLLGDHIYGACGDEGLSITNVADPDPEEWTGHRIETAGHACAVALAGSRVCVADYEGGLRVFEVADPWQPTEVAGRGAPAFGHHITVLGGLAGVALWHGPGAQFYSIANPSAPSLLGGCSTGHFGTSVELSGDISLATSVGECGGTFVCDITDPAQATSELWSGTGTYSVAIQGSYAYAGMGPALEVWNLSHLEGSPTGSCALPETAYDIVVADDMAYCALGSSGLGLVDATDLRHPELVAVIDTPGWAWSVASAGRHVFVGDRTSLRVIDVSDPDSPVEVAVFTPESGGIEDIAVLGSYLYAADPQFGLRMIGISDPLNPVAAGEIEIPQGAGSDCATPVGTSGVAAQGNHVYVAVYGWGILVFQTNSTFADVPPDCWATDAVERCYRAGIVQGYGAATYAPASTVDRGQMSVYIARALAGGDEYVPDSGGAATFLDVPPEHWAHRYVEYAAVQEVVSGYEDDTYHPEDSVNRGQMAVYIARARGWVGLDDDMTTAPELFPDVPAGYWAGIAIQACVENNVVQGYGDGNYGPEVTVSRDQMAVFVTRAFHLGI